MKISLFLQTILKKLEIVGSNQVIISGELSVFTDKSDKVLQRLNLKYWEHVWNH